MFYKVVSIVFRIKINIVAFITKATLAAHI